jgi:hypothetical protein
MSAQGYFVGALAVAVSKTSAFSPTSSMYVKVEAHSIAFSPLYFWIIPAVFASAVIGVSQTEKSVHDILGVLQTKQEYQENHNRLKHVQLPKGPGMENFERCPLRGGVYTVGNLNKDSPKPPPGSCGGSVTSYMLIFSRFLLSLLA